MGCGIARFRSQSLSKGGRTCGAIEEASRSSKAINEHVIINFCDKNAVIARLRDKNVVIARFRDKNVLIARFCDKTAYVWMGILPLKKRVNCALSRQKCFFYPTCIHICIYSYICFIYL